MSSHEERIVSGKAWSELCDLLKAAGHTILKDSSPSDPLSRAEGFRYLSRITRAALETFVENADPLAPRLMRVVHETAKMGADNPDNHYFNACISGAYDYVIRGKRSSVHYLAFATQMGSYGQSRGMPPTGHLDARDLVLGPDGSFEIVISQNSPGNGRNWLPSKPETGTLIVRQTRLDPRAEALAELSIERVVDGASGGPAKPGPLTVELLDKGFSSTGMLVGGAAMIFSGWAEGFQKHVNRLPRFDQNLSNMMGGVPDIAYYHSYWRVAPDEALVIEATPPPCDHWNFQLNNHWMESLDYRFHRIHVNSKTATRRPDGSLRIVVAHTDPGVSDWLETAGHEFGTMCFRWVRPEGEGEPPEPSCRLMKLADAMRLP